MKARKQAHCRLSGGIESAKTNPLNRGNSVGFTPIEAIATRYIDALSVIRLLKRAPDRPGFLPDQTMFPHQRLQFPIRTRLLEAIAVGIADERLIRIDELRECFARGFRRVALRRHALERARLLEAIVKLAHLLGGEWMPVDDESGPAVVGELVG